MSGITMAPRAGVLARLSAPTAFRIALLLYGLLLAGVSVQRLDKLIPDQPGLMGTRSQDAGRAMRTLDSGGPPLLACVERFDADRPLSGCYPAGTTDDQGIYLYLPLIAQVADLTTPEQALKWFYILLFGLLALATPLIYYGLFGSIVAAIVAGAATVFHFDAFANTDLYWISAWCYLLAIPLLLLVYEKWNRWSPLLLGGVVVIGSFATSVRIHAGLPILLGALIVALLRRRSLVGLAATTMIAVLAYLAFAGVLTGVREYRDHTVGDPGLSERHPVRHPFWHNIYIGLGYLPNRYGIEWDDTVSLELVKQKDPDAVYLSPRYEQILRDEVFRIARDDPGFVARNVLTKLGLGLDAARDRFGVVLLALPFALFVGAARHRWRRWLLIAAPALLLSLPPSVLTMPIIQYHLGWFGIWAVLWLLLIGWAITVLPSEIRSRLRGGHEATALGSAVRRALRSPAPWLAVALVALVAVFADLVGPRAAEAITAEDLWREDADALRAPARGDAFAQWRFDGAVAPDWTPTGGVALEGFEGGLELATTPGRSEYQLSGPVVLLSSGSYELRADITVVEGGLELGLLNADADAWLATAHYSYGQPGYRTHDLVVPFELQKPLRVRPILANWQYQPGTSRWLLRHVWIRRA